MCTGGYIAVERLGPGKGPAVRLCVISGEREEPLKRKGVKTIRLVGSGTGGAPSPQAPGPPWKGR